MSVAHLFNSELMGEISAVKSKSFAHRELIAAAFSHGKIDFGTSDDAMYTAQGLKSLGFACEIQGNTATFGEYNDDGKIAVVNCGESGSTLRFLLPLACALGKKTDFVCKGKLASRPIAELTKVLNERGAQIDGYSVRGKLFGGTYEINVSKSSQYLTGLLMSLPILAQDSEIILQGEIASEPYVNITLDVLKKSGIVIEREDKNFKIKGNQKYKSISCELEGDWSGVAFFAVAGALGKGIEIRGLNMESVQGDRAIIDILKGAGAKVIQEENAVCISKNVIDPICIDIENIPDLAPILAVYCACAKGESVLYNVARLKLKESDRLSAIQDMLSKSGIKNVLKDNALHIWGGKVVGADFSGFGDHRMVMASAILAANAVGDSTISDVECVAKSYPNFWQDFATLGGKYEMARR